MTRQVFKSYHVGSVCSRLHISRTSEATAPIERKIITRTAYKIISFCGIQLIYTEPDHKLLQQSIQYNTVANYKNLQKNPSNHRIKVINEKM